MDHLTELQAMEFADGLMPEQLRRQVERHRTECQECARRVDTFLSVRSSVRSLHVPALSRAFAERVTEQVMGEGRTDERWIGPERIAAQTVLALAVLVALLIALSGPTAEATTTATESILSAVPADSSAFMLSSPSSLSRDEVLLAALGREGQP